MPAGFKRSRALWDETKRIDHTASSQLYATICAILYELQPIRFSEVNWRGMMQTANEIVRFVARGISYLPGVLIALVKFMWQHKLGTLGVFVYYLVVRWIHEVLEAGPMVLMFTALAGIFTIGLSDDDNTGLSAYSVFNRGFERLLGSVDAEALLAQHVGMAPGAALPVGVNDNDDARRQRRPRRQERAAAPRAEAQGDNNGDDDNNDNGEDDQAPRNNRARKSGKKARRRNLEQRRDRQRQRDAAMALGMQGATETEQEMMEMQRLIENQIAEANGDNH